MLGIGAGRWPFIHESSKRNVTFCGALIRIERCVLVASVVVMLDISDGIALYKMFMRPLVLAFDDHE